MKHLKHIVLLLAALTLISCNTRSKDGSSHGNINEISIVINDELWNGDVGDSIRKRLAAPIEGLTQEEPIFTLNQYHEDAFDEVQKKERNIIIVKKKSDRLFAFKHNSYCAPQNLFTITGPTTADLLDLVGMHSDEIIRKIKQTEIAENQERNIKGGLLDSLAFNSRYGISINVPATYAFAIQDERFIWLKKDLHTGNTNILIYCVPYGVIEKNKTIAGNIISMRDSIGSKYIHGQDPDTFMSTEEAYSPYLFMTSFKDKRAFETRGNWEMENGSMNGPFINYAIKDDAHERYLIIEGFIYSPSSPKRDFIIELESIIKSTRFQ